MFDHVLENLASPNQKILKSDCIVIDRWIEATIFFQTNSICLDDHGDICLLMNQVGIIFQHDYGKIVAEKNSNHKQSNDDFKLHVNAFDMISSAACDDHD